MITARRRIGDATVYPLERQIERLGERQRVDFKAMEVLLRLAATPGVIVTKEEIFAAVWPDRYVSDNVLAVAIRTLRKALGDEAAAPRFIETVPRVGYRMVAEIENEEKQLPAPVRPIAANRLRFSSKIGTLLVVAVMAVILAAVRWSCAAGSVIVEVRPIEVSREDRALAIVAEQVEERLVSALSREPSTVPRQAMRHSPSALAPAYVVSGVVRRHGERIELTLRVTHRITGDVVWSPLFTTDPRHLEDLPERVQQAFRRGVLPLPR